MEAHWLKCKAVGDSHQNGRPASYIAETAFSQCRTAIAFWTRADSAVMYRQYKH